jgi:hypothetical protein
VLEGNDCGNAEHEYVERMPDSYDEGSARRGRSIGGPYFSLALKNRRAGRSAAPTIPTWSTSG